MNILKICILLTLYLVINSCSPLLKRLARIKNPKVENTQSITKHLLESNIPLQNSYIINCCSDSSTITKNILTGLKGEMMLFDSTGVKYCYKGTDKCTGKQLAYAYANLAEHYYPCANSTTTLYTVLSNATANDGKSLPLSKYYLVVYWAKFAGKAADLSEDYKWLSTLKNNSNLAPTLVFINTDLQERWNLKPGKKMRIKFKLKGRKSAALHFGKVPYND